MLDKYYVRKRGNTAGIKYLAVNDDGKPIDKGENVVVIYGPGLQKNYLESLLGILLIGKSSPVPVVTWGGNKYKRRITVTGVRPKAWGVFTRNLEVRGFKLTPTRCFRRLAR